MTTALLVVDSLRDLVVAGSLPKTPAAVIPPAEEILKRLSAWEVDFIAGQSEATAKAVRADWQVFHTWCEHNKRPAIPASMKDVLQFLTDMVVLGRKRSTINRYLYTVCLIHEAARLPDPIENPGWALKWKGLVKRLVRAKRNAPRQAGALHHSTVVTILASLGDTARDLRDAALLSLASDTLCRESELAVARLQDLTPASNGSAWQFYLANTKTDQEGIGAYRFVSNDTKARVDLWCAEAKIEAGYIFLPTCGRPKLIVDKNNPPPPHLHPAEIAKIFRRRAKSAGITGANSISGHSARVGSAIDLIENGASTTDVQFAGGWKSERMVLHYAKKALAGSNAMAKMRGRQKRTT